MFSAETYINRRKELIKNVGSGIYLFLGNQEAPMNYTDNTYRYRQDSTFLYFFGLNIPGLAALIDADKNEVTLFGNDYTLNDVVWMGPQESLRNLASLVGIQSILPFNDLFKKVKSETQFLPAYRGDNKILLSELLGLKVSELKPSEKLTKAVIKLRSIKEPQELEAMTKAVNISGEMHMAVKGALKAGVYEYEMVAKIMEKLHSKHAELSYPVICSTNGQYLHNHNHSQKCEAGKILLLDTGAEMELGYAGDITRSFAVSGSFSTKQQEIYDTVLNIENSVIELLKPGISYLEMHKYANKLMLNNLKEIGLLKGDMSEAQELGLGGMFMPHGLGHMIGLDVHDMEDLNENWVGYADDQVRSTQLGLRSLRLAKNLEAGMVLTVEPGIYFVPGLIADFKSQDWTHAFVNYSKLESYADFGGIRLEDNVAITESSFTVLGDAIEK